MCALTRFASFARWFEHFVRCAALNALVCAGVCRRVRARDTGRKSEIPANSRPAAGGWLFPRSHSGARWAFAKLRRNSLRQLTDAHARAQGLSPFDKVIGGMAWAITNAAGDLDIDIFFQENAQIGQKM